MSIRLEEKALPKPEGRAVRLERMVFYALASIALAVIVLACWRVLERPGLQTSFTQTTEGPQVTKVYQGGAGERHGLKVGDVLIAIGGDRLSHVDAISFHIDKHRIGDRLSLTVQREAVNITLPVTLSREIGALEFWTTALAALCFWLIGVLVILKSTNPEARLFFLGCLAVAIAIAVVWPGAPFKLGLLVPYAYLIVYPLVPPLLVHFAARFPQPHPVLSRAPWPLLFYAPAFILSVVLLNDYHMAISSQSESDYLHFNQTYTYFRVFIIAMFVLAVSLFFFSFRRAGKTGTAHGRQVRDQLRWIFWGLSIGAFPFFFLYTTPILLERLPIFNEALTAFFLLLIPLSFAISIIRYQALDVNLVINRSLVYFSSTAGVVALYLGLVAFTSATMHSFLQLSSTAISIFATLVAAAAFGPLRNKMQKIVDRTFYRIRYDYRQALGRFRGAIAEVVDPDHILQKLLAESDAVIGIEKPALIAFPPQIDMQFYPLVDFPYSTEIAKSLRQLITNSPQPHVQATLRERFVGYGVLPMGIPATDAAMPVVALPLLGKKKLCGVLLCGPKKSGAAFQLEDVELLVAMCGYAALAIENIWLAQEMIYVQAEREKLAALNELKNTFVSHVSHELRSPLTAIKWSIENLQDGMAGEPSLKAREYYTHLLESSNHLLRMIENLLDVAHIESGEVPFHPETIDVVAHTRSVVRIFASLAEEKNVRVILDSADDQLMVFADRDALREILQNLLDNAIKHTASGTTVRVQVSRSIDSAAAKITVADSGPGIPPEVLPHLFDRFGKFSQKKKSPGRGLGVGLSIVKNLVERQGGQISVESAVSKGSRFIFTVPLAKSAAIAVAPVAREENV